MITFIAWKWRSPRYRITFTAEHVNVLADMLERACGQYRLICITDDPKGIKCETFQLWDDYAELPNPCAVHPDSAVFPSCYRRLRIFDPRTTRLLGIRDGEHVCSIDLDVVILPPIDDLIGMWPEADFVGWRNFVGAAWKRSHAYNGSLFRFRAGRLDRLWRDFHPSESPRLAKDAGFFGSDQAWMGYCLEDRGYPAWTKDHGVISFAANLCPMRGKGGALPTNAKIVCFNGRQKPWDDDVRARWSWVGRYHKPMAAQPVAV